MVSMTNKKKHPSIIIKYPRLSRALFSAALVNQLITGHHKLIKLSSCCLQTQNTVSLPFSPWAAQLHDGQLQAGQLHAGQLHDGQFCTGHPLPPVVEFADAGQLHDGQFCTGHPLPPVVEFAAWFSSSFIGGAV